jgi:crotonobetainyl-CoA:carnitine CoA-transferase CaiB-like acyl-CoA transferase
MSGTSAPVLDGIRIIDLSTGIAGPVATMLLAGQGASVTVVQRPGGDPLTPLLHGSRVWRRGAAPVEIDLTTDDGRARLDQLVGEADVLVESHRPGVAARLGVDFDRLHALNPQLVVCTIDGYGDHPDHAGRPAYDALVAARTGQQWEHRGVVGGTIGRLSGTGGMMPGIEMPDDCWVGADRDGPLFGGLAWPSMAAAYLATVGISSALYVRERTGRGQHVHTSLLQGVLATTIGAWQRVERPDTPNYQTWVIDPRTPKGFFQCSDGGWTHHWVPLPGFILGASEGDELALGPDVTNPRASQMRIGTHPEEMVVLHAMQTPMAEAVAKFPAQAWTDFAADVGVPVQRVRSPEEALDDPALVDDGCVVEVEDPEHGRIRTVGNPVRITTYPAAAAAPPRPEAPAPSSPLDGVVVLDLGLAVAGPFGTQVLGDLGADVIKVNNALFDKYWMRNHIAFACNRSKRSITIDLKTPEGLAVLHELVERADVVQHNMRYDAAIRLHVDEPSLRRVKPDLIYCHTRGHDRGPREQLPGNDQTGAALAGVEWLEGGLSDGGRPLWPITSLGDTGNGFLSAIGIIQALRHRDLTGEGSFVDTSILYAHLVNASNAFSTGDGVPHRPRLDAEQFGWSEGYRIYPTANGWLTLAALDAATLSRARAVVGEDLAAGFLAKPAGEWRDLLDAANVPSEVSDPDFVLGLFDDPWVRKQGWVTSYEQPIVGRMDVFGQLIDFSDTPGRIAGPPLVPGQDTRQILAELGKTPEQIDALIAAGTVSVADGAGDTRSG